MTHSVARTRPLVTPAFYCPIPARVHARCDTFDRAALSWLREYQLAPPELLTWLRGAEFGQLTGRTMPHGRQGALMVVARLHAVLFALDDGVCDEVDASPLELTHETQRILRVLEAPSPVWPDDSTFSRALREIRLQLDEYLTPSQVGRWVEGMRTYLTALPWEAEWRRVPDDLPSLSDYAAMWMRAIGMAPSTALLEAVGGYQVPEAELKKDGVRACTEITWTLVSWDNDLYSRAKETTRAGDTLNLVDVLAREQDISLEEAQERAVQMRDRVMTLFLTLREQLIPQVSEGTRRYLADLGHFVRGHLDWASNCPRYDGGAGRDSGWWTPHPLEATLEPVDVPSIRWWWQQLDGSARPVCPAGPAIPLPA